MTEISILTESNFNRHSLDTYVRTHNVRRACRTARELDEE